MECKEKSSRIQETLNLLMCEDRSNTTISSLNQPSGLIYSLSCNFLESSVGVFVCELWEKIRFLVDWKLLVEEYVTTIGIPLKVLKKKGTVCFLVFVTSLLCIIG